MLSYKEMDEEKEIERERGEREKRGEGMMKAKIQKEVNGWVNGNVKWKTPHDTEELASCICSHYVCLMVLMVERIMEGE